MSYIKSIATQQRMNCVDYLFHASKFKGIEDNKNGTFIIKSIQQGPKL
jgi:hypothetical protein